MEGLFDPSNMLFFVVIVGGAVAFLVGRVLWRAGNKKNHPSSPES